MEGKRTLTIYPNELRRDLDETAEPTVEVLGGTDSLNESLDAGDQVADVQDMDNRAAVAISTAGVSDKPRVDIALEKRLKADFCIIDGLNARAVYPAAVRALLGIYHDTTATWGTATEVAVNNYVSGLLGKGRPWVSLDGVDDYGSVADDADLDFGYGDGSIEMLVYMPDVSGDVYWYDRYQNGDNQICLCYDSGAKVIRCLTKAGGTTVQYAVGSWTPVAHTKYHIVWVFVNGVSNAIYIDNQLISLSTDTKTGGDISIATALEFGKRASSYYQYDMWWCRQFNRALTAGEVADLYNGEDVAAADRYGAMTELMPNQVDRDFSGASAWANVDLFSYDETTDGVLAIAGTGGQYCTLLVASAPMTATYHYRLQFDYARVSDTGFAIKDFTGAQTLGTVTAPGTNQSISFTVAAGLTGGLRLVASAGGGDGVFDNFSLVRTGCVLELSHDGISKDQGKMLDASGNDLHATLTGVDYHDVPEGDGRGFLLAKFDTVEAPDWFLQLNEAGKTALAGKNLEVGQVCKGESMALDVIFEEDPLERPGIETAEAYGGAETGVVRYGGRRWAREAICNGLTDAEKERLEEIEAAQEGHLWPFYVGEPDPDTGIEVARCVRFDGAIEFTRTGALWSAIVPLRECARE